MEKYSVNHELKIEGRYLDRIIAGQKRFEIRRNDRDFQVGDWMKLHDQASARSVACKIIYISNYEQKENYVVLGFTIGEEK